MSFTEPSNAVNVGMAKQIEGRPQLALWLGTTSRIVAILVALQSPLNDTNTKRQQLPKAEATVLGQSKEIALCYYKRQIRSVLKLCPDT